jgi:hypothetical protein
MGIGGWDNAIGRGGSLLILETRQKPPTYLTRVGSTAPAPRCQVTVCGNLVTPLSAAACKSGCITRFGVSPAKGSLLDGAGGKRGLQLLALYNLF